MELRNRCSDDMINQCSLWPIIPNESWSPDFLNALALGCLAKVRPSSCHPFDMDPKTSPSPQAPRCRLQLEYTNEPIWTEKLRQYDFINMKFNTEFGYREYYIDLYGAIWHRVKTILNKQTVTRSQDYSSISILNNLNQGDGIEYNLHQPLTQTAPKLLEGLHCLACDRTAIAWKTASMLRIHAIPLVAKKNEKNSALLETTACKAYFI